MTKHVTARIAALMFSLAACLALALAGVADPAFAQPTALPSQPAALASQPAVLPTPPAATSSLPSAPAGALPARAETRAHTASLLPTLAERERFHHLAGELRCLVCQNQTLADSDADLAADLRREVEELMLAGRSDDEIKAYLVQRYGDFVLYRPPLQQNTWLLWLGPFGLLVVGAVVWWRVQRGHRETAGGGSGTGALRRSSSDARSASQAARPAPTGIRGGSDAALERARRLLDD